MKPEVRTVGFDDAPFRFDDGTVPVVGVIMRGARYVDGVLRADVTVDGWDATEVLADMLLGSRFRDEARYVLLDGIALGGFNVVDLHDLHDRLDRPVVTVTRGEPDRDAMEAALRKHHEDWEARLEIIDRTWPEPLETMEGTLSVRAVGMDREDVGTLLHRTTVRGLVPEPVRLAHLVASAIVTGESTGPA